VKKKKTAPTMTDRLADAGAALTSGLAMFEEAAMRLDAAQVAHEEVVSEIENEIARLHMLAASASSNASRAARAADKVRDLIA
jgi:hypothetical protein